MTVRDLRRRWKPHKDRLNVLLDQHPTNIRFHRACSWIQQAELIEPEKSDLVLMCQWVAFNALYGQWNSQAREPEADRQGWRTFLHRIAALDKTGYIKATLVEHRKLVLAIVDDAYLASFFWRDPSVSLAVRTTRDRHHAPTWYLEQKWTMILEAVLERVYLLRCQLMHGAATFASARNRKSLSRCITIMNQLLPAILSVYIDHGPDEDWGSLCYPPIG
jgi:hypothetical protein